MFIHSGYSRLSNFNRESFLDKNDEEDEEKEEEVRKKWANTAKLDWSEEKKVEYKNLETKESQNNSNRCNQSNLKNRNFCYFFLVFVHFFKIRHLVPAKTGTKN